MKRSEMALIANESLAVVFEERECSLDLLLRFASRQNEGRELVLLNRQVFAEGNLQGLSDGLIL